MPTAWVIEPVDVLEDGRLNLSAGFPRASPDQLGLDGFEEGLDCGVVIAVTLAAHRHFDPMLAQNFLVVMRTVLAATVTVEDAAFGR